MTVTENHTEREKNIADKRNLMYEHQALESGLHLLHAINVIMNDD
jgi:hypothetical protein